MEPGPGARCPTRAMSAANFPALDPNVKREAIVSAPSRNPAEGLRADPDAELVSAWQSGDLGSFETLVRRHQARIYRLVLRMLGSREEAEDVVQEAFISLYRHGHSFRREARFSTFLYRVATNAALNRRRTLGRSRARTEELERRQAAGDHLPSAPRDPEGAAVGQEVREQVQEALLELSDDLRAAIVLYDIEGQSYREISRILDIPEGTVKSRIHRARSALRLRLDPSVGRGELEVES